MNYTDRNGNVVTGTVWSPGPEANTLWVLEQDGTPVVVKVPRGDITKAVEQDYALPRLENTRYGVCWTSMTLMRGLPSLDRILPEDYRHAPKLSNKVWNAAVGDQCTQMELAAA